MKDEAVGTSTVPPTRVHREGRIGARPVASASPTEVDAPRGTRPLGLGRPRDGIVYVPPSYRADAPAPLLVALHGAGGAAVHGLAPFEALEATSPLIVLAPDSRGSTWDVILDDQGPDVAFLDAALAWTFARYAIDPERIAIAGFSDGASYAASLALANGHLFRRAVAFSPGFAAPGEREGKPRFFVTHGVHDDVLPIGRCSRPLVARLRRAGYEVTYREFDGGHWVPPELVRDALAWLATP